MNPFKTATRLIGLVGLVSLRLIADVSELIRQALGRLLGSIEATRTTDAVGGRDQ